MRYNIGTKNTKKCKIITKLKNNIKRKTLDIQGFYCVLICDVLLKFSDLFPNTEISKNIP